jgi:hypothetical protein
LAYWLGELDEAAASRLEEHLLGCGACSARLGSIVELGAAIRRELVSGSLGSVLAPKFVERLKAAGLRVREYDLPAGGSVDCTITPDDDLVVAHLHVPLRGVRRIDGVFEDAAAGLRYRATDLAFDPSADRVTYMPSADYLRTLDRARQRVTLLAVDGVEERVLADYTFNHSRS